MRNAILTLTKTGFELGEKISARIGGQIFHKGRNFDSLKDFVAEIFDKFDGLIFICATGIAVRMIAPHIVSKLSDPAVIVIDERGQNVISLLSGHVGGGNDLTLKIATAINANPVITTATDVEKKFAVDSFAAKLGLIPTPKTAIKAINSAVLRDEPIFIKAGSTTFNLNSAVLADEKISVTANNATFNSATVTAINSAILADEKISVTANNATFNSATVTAIKSAVLADEKISVTANNATFNSATVTAIKSAVLADKKISVTADNATFNSATVTAIKSAVLADKKISVTADNATFNSATVTAIKSAILADEKISVTADNATFNSATVTAIKSAILADEKISVTANNATFNSATVTAINSAILADEKISVTANNATFNSATVTAIKSAILADEKISATAGDTTLNLATVTAIKSAVLADEKISATAGDTTLNSATVTAINSAVLANEKIFVTADSATLNLIPQKLIAGIGCKRGSSAEKISCAVAAACQMINQPLERIKLLASVDIKRDEGGLLEFAKNLGVEIKFFSVEQLTKKIAEYKLSESNFVKATIGVGNVCEAAALCCVEKARFALTKKTFDGVTVALIWQKI